MSLKQWETYYRGGALATGPKGAGGSYDLEVRQAWVEFFSTQHDGARLLDIGTGNGAIALIALETAAALGRHWEIHATDLAQIDPVHHVKEGERLFAGISFHAGVAAERLPFEAGSFDAVSGHYALEYTNVPAAFAEIHRVLKAGGDAQFILQNADSQLVRNAKWSLQESDFVFKETKVFRRLHRLVTMDNVSRDTLVTATAEFRAGLHSLKEALQRAQAVGGGHMLSVAIDSIQKLLVARKTQPAQTVERAIARVEEDMRDSTRRLNDLVTHARTGDDMETIQGEAAAAGFTLIECLPQHHAGKNLVGWQLLMHRA